MMNEFKELIGRLKEPDYKYYGCELSGSEANIAISALEKQIPKKVDRVGNKCPICKCYLASEPVGDHYCFQCGQAIDWSVEE